jgi:hypothetical protein
MAAGDYVFTVIYTTSSVAGIVDFYMDGVSVATGLDTYTAGNVSNNIYTININGLSAGHHTFKYITNGKNASSSNYAFFIQKIYFKQATD